jgi:hypothetical protein
MKFKGTRGKWYLQKFTDVYTNIIRCDNGEHSTIYIASTLQSSSKETRFNALLMSKAPEMLEMLEIVCTELYKTDNELATKVKQLIKEATEL